MKNTALLFGIGILLISCQRVHQHSGWNTKNVQIARDEYGVPHIFGKTDADAAYGLAWAHSEDDFETIQKTVLAGKGLAGRVFGEEGAAIDFFVQLLETKEIAKAKYESSFSPEFKKVLEGYAAGLNDYAFHHPEELLYAPAFPITAQEISSAYILSLAQMAGADRAVQAIFKGTVPKIAEDSLPKGSNAIAIHPSRTDTGEAFLAINSHQPLEGPVAWYEAHIHSEEGWNALGGLFPGGAMIFHGVNEHLGWAHTVNSPDLLDLYQLELDPEDPSRYRVDGEWLILEEKTVWLKVKLWDWFTLPVPQTVWKSIYGPTLVTEKGTFAIRMGALDRIGAPEQWWRMNKASNFQEWKAAMATLQLPNFNTVYADRYDTIYYVSNALLPKRVPGIDHSETVIGNRAAVAWKDYHSFEELPQQLNPSLGYLFHTNHSPFKAGALADTLLADAHPREMGFDLRDNNRSVRFRELMPEEGKISWQQFNQLKFDQTLPKDLAFRTNLQSFFTLNPEMYPELEAQIIALATWNKEADIKSEGAALFAFVYYYWWDEFTKTGTLSNPFWKRIGATWRIPKASTWRQSPSPLGHRRCTDHHPLYGLGERHAKGCTGRILHIDGSLWKRTACIGKHQRVWSEQSPRFPALCRSNGTFCGTKIKAHDPGQEKRTSKCETRLSPWRLTESGTILPKAVCKSEGFS